MRRAVFAIAILVGCGLVAFAQSLDDDEIDGAPREQLSGLTAKAPAPAGRDGAASKAEPDESKGMEASEQQASNSGTAETKPRAEEPAAKVIFSSLATPAPLAPRAIGGYSRGCLAGGKALPIDGEVWQVMRLSRNRNWGHPKLVEIIERLAEDGAAKDGWPGLLVGDISQPRGGPMPSDHASHQIGLDGDVWLTPMPYKRLSYQEREEMPFTSMLGADRVHVDPEVFTPYHAAIIRRAASYPEVERIFVHPGIKKAMCQEEGADRTYFHKIRPYWGHHEHMHIRIACPPGSTGCRTQATAAGDDGCGREVDNWLSRMRPIPRPAPVAVLAATKPRASRRSVSLDDLPDQCREVAAAGSLGYVRAGTNESQHGTLSGSLSTLVNP